MGCWFAFILLLSHPDGWGALWGSRYVGLLCGVFVWCVSRMLRFMGVGLCGLVFVVFQNYFCFIVYVPGTGSH